MIKLENFLSVKQYAWLCGVPNRTIYGRIRSKRVSVVRIGGYYFIDIKKSPPEKRVSRHTKPMKGKADLPPGIDYGNLITPEQFADSRKMRASRIYRAILTGQLRAVIAGDTVFVDKDEAANFLKTG